MARNGPFNRFARSQPRSHSGAIAHEVQVDPNWKKYDSFKLAISGLPEKRRNCLDVFNLVWFHCQTVVRIDCPQRAAQGIVYLEFRPPPESPFWTQPNFGMINGERFKLRIRSMPPQAIQDEVQSPIDASHTYPKHMRLPAESLEMGFLKDPSCMMVMSRCDKPKYQTNTVITFSANLERTEIEIRFPLSISARSEVQAEWVENLRVQIQFTHISSVKQIDISSSKRALILQLEIPPEWHMMMRDIRKSIQQDPIEQIWNEMLAWERQTDIVKSIYSFRKQPIQLQKPETLIDLGRWLTFRIVFDLNANGLKTFERLHAALNDWNVQFDKISAAAFTTTPRETCDIWNIIDAGREVEMAQGGLMGLLQLSANIKHLDFKVRYQLEVCISRGFLNEYNISQEFLRKLGNSNSDQACANLEYVAERKIRLYDPMALFPLKSLTTVSSRSLPGYCILARSCTITPTSILWNTPAVETSNRVIRQYIQHQDRFLRVRFCEEGHYGKLHSRHNSRDNELFEKVNQAMNRGIVLGDRRYEFLAFGNSQFREHSAYFFASLPGLTVGQIRRELGDFSDILTPAKWCARLGQNFSTTRSIRTTVLVKDALDDVEVNGFNFTDGVGKISKFLAHMIADEFKLPHSSDDLHSLFQFRLGGCKGVLAVAPELPGRELHIRPSQYKFPAKHHGLEVIRVSQYVTSTLNRQLITILSALGINDDVFSNMMQCMLDELELAMSDKKVALSLLTKNIDFNQSTLILAEMIMNGFMDAQEPFMMAILELWRSWILKYLKEKAKIFVGNGAHLLGCVDEYCVLQGHFNEKINGTQSVREEDLPEIFVKIDAERNGKYQVVEGLCILARNPSLHVGDIRVVRAVNKPQLQHLKNVVVLPQTGDRDLASMCSGGDLDGDDYLVIWDESLVPKRWSVQPMDFTPVVPRPLDRPVVVEDITEFFVQFIKNDNLATIASAHLAFSDSESDGAMSDKCLRLATLHSHAVDYPKSGIPAIMSKDLSPRRWPHFMERRYKNSYHSEKILGKLYDMVERKDFCPEFDHPFDERVLNAYELGPEILRKAQELKQDYDAAMKRVMVQHDIQTEFEVWSAFVMSHNREKKDYTFAEELGLICQIIKETHSKLCINAAGGKEFEKLGPFVAAMYSVTHQEVQEALKTSDGELKSRASSAADSWDQIESVQAPLISFPWIFHREMGMIAIGHAASRSLLVVQGEQKRLRTKLTPAAQEIETDILVEKGSVPAGEYLKLFEDDEAVDEDGNPGIKSGASKDNQTNGLGEHASTIQDNRNEATLSSSSWIGYVTPATDDTIADRRHSSASAVEIPRTGNASSSMASEELRALFAPIMIRHFPIEGKDVTQHESGTIKDENSHNCRVNPGAVQSPKQNSNAEEDLGQIKNTSCQPATLGGTESLSVHTRELLGLFMDHMPDSHVQDFAHPDTPTSGSSMLINFETASGSSGPVMHEAQASRPETPESSHTSSTNENVALVAETGRATGSIIIQAQSGNTLIGRLNGLMNDE